MEDIISIVCRFFKVSKEELMIKRSCDKVSTARMFAVYILHNDFNYSISCLAKRFDILRSSVFAIARKARNRINLYIEDYAYYDELLAQIDDENTERKEA